MRSKVATGTSIWPAAYVGTEMCVVCGPTRTTRTSTWQYLVVTRPFLASAPHLLALSHAPDGGVAAGPQPQYPKAGRL